MPDDVAMILRMSADDYARTAAGSAITHHLQTLDLELYTNRMSPCSNACCDMPDTDATSFVGFMALLRCCMRRSYLE